MEKEVKIRLPKGKEVELLDTSIKDGHIVVKYSLKEEFIQQHGDIIFVKSGDDTFIEVFDCYKDDCIWCSCYLSLRTDSFRNKKGYLTKREIDEIRLAIKVEKALLFNALKGKGLTWNEETKEVENIRWRAEMCGIYYFIDSCGKVIKDIDNRWFPDDSRFLSGNYFKTREDAEPYSQKAKELFKSNA